MDWRSAFKGTFIAAVEFQGKEPTLTIRSVELAQVEDEKTKKEKTKLAVYFKEIDRGWIPCKTAALCLAALFKSNETNTWVGKRVTLFCDPTVQLGRETVEGIRVRGSPDITEPVQVEIKLPKKRPQVVTMQPTGAKS